MDHTSSSCLDQGWDHLIKIANVTLEKEDHLETLIWDTIIVDGIDELDGGGTLDYLELLVKLLAYSDK